VEALVRKHDVEFKVCFPTVFVYFIFMYVIKCMSAFGNISVFVLTLKFVTLGLCIIFLIILILRIMGSSCIFLSLVGRYALF
jgi:hypothetical protein